jgi:hypothetical protein
LGWQAWRYGAIAFTFLGLSFTPFIYEELKHYNNRMNYPEPINWETETIEEAAVEMAPEEDVELEPLDQEFPFEVEDNAPEEQ